MIYLKVCAIFFYIINLCVNISGITIKLIACLQLLYTCGIPQRVHICIALLPYLTVLYWWSMMAEICNYIRIRKCGCVRRIRKCGCVRRTVSGLFLNMFWRFLECGAGEWWSVHQLDRSCAIWSVTLGQWLNECPTYSAPKRRAHIIGRMSRSNCPIKHIIEGKIEGTKRRGIRCKQLLVDGKVVFSKLLSFMEELLK